MRKQLWYFCVSLPLNAFQKRSKLSQSDLCFINHQDSLNLMNLCVLVGENMQWPRADFFVYDIICIFIEEAKNLLNTMRLREIVK